MSHSCDVIAGENTTYDIAYMVESETGKIIRLLLLVTNINDKYEIICVYASVERERWEKSGTW